MEEMKKLVTKKHDYLGRLLHNRKSVQSLKRYLESAMQLLHDTVKQNNRVGIVNYTPSDVKSIEESLKMIYNELDGPEDVVLSKSTERIASPYLKKDNKSSKMANSINLKRENKLTIDEIMKSKKDEKDNNNERNTVQAVILPNIGLKRAVYASNERLNKIRKNYDYIVLRNNRTSNKTRNASSNLQPINKKKEKANTKTGIQEIKSGSRSTSRENEKKPETLVINDWDPMLEDTYLKYEDTSEFDYSRIMKKTEHLMILKEKVEKGLKEKEKVYEKKFKDIEITIKKNQKKLGVFKQVTIILFINIM